MLQSLDVNDFDKAYAIMELSFPSYEHRGYCEQKKLLEDSKYNIYAVYDQSPHDSRNNRNTDIKAIIAFFDFKEFIFIEHFAVNPAYRNSGLGSKVLNEFKSLSKRQICLEVELPETINAKRRIAFYERNDFYLNYYNHFQPPLSKGFDPVPLYIMTSDHALKENEFRYVQKILFNYVYHSDIDIKQSQD